MQSGLVLISAIFAVIISAQSASIGRRNIVGEKTLALSRECAIYHNIPDERTILAFSPEMPQNEAERCFLECCYRGHSFIEGDKLSYAAVMKVINLRYEKPEEIALSDKIVHTCAKEVKANDAEKCSLGGSIRECFVKNGKKVDFFPRAL